MATSDRAGVECGCGWEANGVRVRVGVGAGGVAVYIWGGGGSSWADGRRPACRWAATGLPLFCGPCRAGLWA